MNSYLSLNTLTYLNSTPNWPPGYFQRDQVPPLDQGPAFSFPRARDPTAAPRKRSASCCSLSGVCASRLSSAAVSSVTCRGRPSSVGRGVFFSFFLVLKVEKTRKNHEKTTGTFGVDVKNLSTRVIYLKSQICKR